MYVKEDIIHYIVVNSVYIDDYVCQYILDGDSLIQPINCVSQLGIVRQIAI